MKCIWAAGLALLCITAYGQDSKITEIANQIKAARKSGDMATVVKESAVAREALAKLIQGDQFSSAADLKQAADIYPASGRLQDVEVRYELYLSALILGDKSAKAGLLETWDDLQVSTSRPRRLGVVKMVGAGSDSGRYRVTPTAPVILDALIRTDEFLKAHDGEKDNAEIKKLVDADQAARGVDFSRLKPEELEKIERDDRERQLRIRDLVTEGAPHTATDFESAALILQHGETWDDYRFAHELCLAAIALGSKELAPWLAGASYDRMLRSANYPQRFCTQFSSEGMTGAYVLDEYSSFGICDAERKAVVHRSLAEALEQAKKFGS